jgi:glycosyltransferase involved in cell wall biosynthesis
VIRPFGTLSRYTFSHRRQALKKAWFAAIDRKNVREAAAVHFTSEAEKAEAARHELDLGDRGRVVPPPFLPVARQDLVARRENIVLFLSRLDPVKNIESLLAAWPLVAAERRDWKLIIGGSGSASYEADLKALAESSNAGNSISFAGFLTGDRKSDLLSRARLFVLPSQHENFGIAVLEAISAGIPVILTPQVQLAPFVQLHRLGLVTSSETSSLARAIIEGIDDAGLQNRAARLGDDLVQRSFGPNVIGKELMALYGAAIDYASHDRKRQFSSKS